MLTSNIENQETVQNVLQNYLQRETEKPSLKRFVFIDVAYVIRNSPPKDVKKYWNEQFTKAIEECNIKEWSREQPDWSCIYETLLKGITRQPQGGSQQPQQQSQENTTTTNTSSVDDKKLSEADQEKIRKAFTSVLQSNNLWTLSTGKVVEEEMFKFSNTCIYEHPVHSFIFDCSDENWEEYFTAEELQEIRNHRPQILPTLPHDLEVYLTSYANKITLDSILKHTESYSFHPLKHPDHCWIKQTIEKALDLEYYQYLKKARTEPDLMQRVWGFISHCYDECDISATTGEKDNSSSSSNDSHALPTSECLAREEVCTKVDMLFTYHESEIGIAVTGGTTDTADIESFTETSIKCPKTMKAMFDALLVRHPLVLRSIATFGFVITGLNINLLIMDCPAGQVCRIVKLPQFLSYPNSPETLVRDLSAIIRLVHGTKTMMKNVVHKLQSIQGTPSFSFTAVPSSTIPPCFYTTPSTPIQRKRNSNPSNSSNNNNTPRLPKRTRISDKTNIHSS